MGKLFIAVVIFLIIGAYLIVLRNDIDLEEREGKKTFVYKFSSWVYGVGKNVVNVVGYAIKQDWLPERSKIENTEISSDQNKTKLFVVD